MREIKLLRSSNADNTTFHIFAQLHLDNICYRRVPPFTPTAIGYTVTHYVLIICKTSSLLCHYMNVHGI